MRLFVRAASDRGLHTTVLSNPMIVSRSACSRYSVRLRPASADVPPT